MVNWHDNPMARALRRLSPPTTHEEFPAEHPNYERLAIPHSFKPQMSVLEAMAAALGMFLRIVLSSLLFAVLGACSLMARSRIHNLLLRLPVLLALLVLFALGVLLLVAATRWVEYAVTRLRS